MIFPDQSSRFAYVMRHFHLAYEVPALDFSQHETASSKVFIPLSPLAAVFEEKKSISEDDVQWLEWKGKSIPFLFGTPSHGTFFEIVDSRLIFHVDLISHVFFFLSGWQELVSTERDALGRFPYQSSLQYKLGFAKLPVVNYYFDIFKSGIEALLGNLVPLRLLNPRGPVVYLSHDIDSCQNAWLQGGKNELKAGRIISAIKLMLNKLAGKDDWFNFDHIHQIEQRRTAKSSFYFLARNNRVNGLANADYDITSKTFQAVFETIETNGSEVGIHGSLGTSTDIGLFRSDISRIGHRVSGGRFHFLSYDPQKTVSVMEDAGIGYDSSLGFAETIGFRNGYCHPFFLYNHVTQAQSPVLEIPLMVMDATLQFKKYMGLNPEAALTEVKSLFEEVQKWGGVVSVLWHNTHFSEHKYAGWCEVYERILDYAQSRAAVFMTGNEIRSVMDQRVI